MKRDYYEVLGVAKEAALDEIKKSYRKLAMQFHPDQNPGNKEAEERFKEAAEAYSVLSDADKRRKYDQFGHAGMGNQGGGAGGFQFDPNQFTDFQDIFGGLFGDLFGGGGGRRRSGGGHPGSDLQYTMRISFKEALFGVDAKELEIPRQEACGDCRGNGCAPGTSPQVCPQCRGQGQVVVRQMMLQMYVPCPRCEGRGQIILSPCGGCRGGGRVQKRAKVSFRIPPGVDRGQKLRLQGEGEAGTGGGGKGDLYIVFDVEEDPLYQRDGSDLHRKLEVPWPLLVLGGQMPFETPYGKDSLKVAAGSASDKIQKIPNAGVQKLRGSGRGDLYLHFRVPVPTRVTPEQKAVIASLLEPQAVDGETPEEEGFLAKVFGSDKGKKKKNR